MLDELFNLRGDFRGDFQGTEDDGHPKLLVRLPFRGGKAVFMAFLHHEHAAAPGLFHEAAEVEHMGDVRITEDGDVAFLQLLDGDALGQTARVPDFEALREDMDADAAGGRTVVAMDERIDERLAHGIFRVER